MSDKDTKKNKKNCVFCNSSAHWSVECLKNEGVVKELVDGEMPDLANIDKKMLKNMVMYIRKQKTMYRVNSVKYSYPAKQVTWLGGELVKKKLPVHSTDGTTNAEDEIGKLSKATKGKLIKFLKLHYKMKRVHVHGIMVSDSHEKAIREGDSCAVCLSELTIDSRTTTTHCGHVFCTGCFTQHVQQQGHSGNRVLCPMCRAPILLRTEEEAREEQRQMQEQRRIELQRRNIEDEIERERVRMEREYWQRKVELEQRRQLMLQRVER